MLELASSDIVNYRADAVTTLKRYVYELHVLIRSSRKFLRMFVLIVDSIYSTIDTFNREKYWMFNSGRKIYIHV